MLVDVAVVLGACHVCFDMLLLLPGVMHRVMRCDRFIIVVCQAIFLLLDSILLPVGWAAKHAAAIQA